MYVKVAVVECVVVDVVEDVVEDVEDVEVVDVVGRISGAIFSTHSKAC